MESSLREILGDLVWLDTPPLARSTRRRLFIAMGMASILLAALLTLDVELKIDVPAPTGSQQRLLTIDIQKDEGDRTADFEAGRHVTTPRPDGEQPSREPERAETTAPRPREIADDAAEPPVEPVAARDWNALAARIAGQTVDDHFRKEKARASLWRQTRSVMFRPDGDIGVAGEQEPLLANLKFRQPAGVLGLGLTVGSCFIGIPLAGIPVEERSTAITLVYCRE